MRHICTQIHTPVNHGGVAGVHMDANAVTGFGISSPTDSMQTLKYRDEQICLLGIVAL